MYIIYCVRPPNDDSQALRTLLNAQCGSPDDDLQAFIDEFDLMIVCM